MEHSTRLKILVGVIMILVSLSSFTLVLSNFSVEKEMSELLIFYEDLVESAFGEPLTAGVILSTRATVKMRSSGECPCGCCVALSKDLMEKTGIQIGQRVILSELGVYSVIGEVEGCGSRVIVILNPSDKAAELFGERVVAISWVKQ